MLLVMVDFPRLELDLQKRLCESLLVSDSFLKSSANGEASCAEGTLFTI